MGQQQCWSSPPRRRRLQRQGLAILVTTLLLLLLGLAAAVKTKPKDKKQAQKKVDPYDNRDRSLFWLQDPRDNTCLGPHGFGVCSEMSSLWMLADRKGGAALVAPFETGNAQMCLDRKWCHSAESPVAIGPCKACGAKHWQVTKDRRGYVKVSEDKGKNCLVRSKPLPGGKQDKIRRYKNSAMMSHCEKGYTGLVLAKAELNDGFFLQAADGFCFDGSGFVACNMNDWRLRWGVGIKFKNNGQADRYFYKIFETDVCLQRTGKGPRLGDCSHWGAKRWSLQDGRLAHDSQHCIVRNHDNSAAFVKCSEGYYEHISPIPYESSLAPTVGGGGAGVAPLPLGY